MRLFLYELIYCLFVLVVSIQELLDRLFFALMATAYKIFQKILTVKVHNIFITIHDFFSFFMVSHPIKCLCFFFGLLSFLKQFYPSFEQWFEVILFASICVIGWDTIRPIFSEFVNLLNFPVLQAICNVFEALYQGTIFVLAEFRYLLDELEWFVLTIFKYDFLTNTFESQKFLIQGRCFVADLVNSCKNDFQNPKASSFEKGIYFITGHDLLRVFLQECSLFLLMLFWFGCVGLDELPVFVDEVVDKDVFLYLGTAMENSWDNFVERKVALFLSFD